LALPSVLLRPGRRRTEPRALLLAPAGTLAALHRRAEARALLALPSVLLRPGRRRTELRALLLAPAWTLGALHLRPGTLPLPALPSVLLRRPGHRRRGRRVRDLLDRRGAAVIGRRPGRTPVLRPGRRRNQARGGDQQHIF
jgi:hypothetical protein